MEKIRVYKLAQELNKSSKELMDVLTALQIPVKSHMSVVSEEEKKKVLNHLADPKQAPAHTTSKQSAVRQAPTAKTPTKQMSTGRTPVRQPNTKQTSAQTSTKQTGAKQAPVKRESKGQPNKENARTQAPQRSRKTENSVRDGRKPVQGKIDTTTSKKAAQEKKQTVKPKDSARGPKDTTQRKRTGKPIDLSKKQKKRKSPRKIEKDKDELMENEVIINNQGNDGIFEIEDTIVVADLAKLLDVPSTDIILSLIKMGIMANINQSIKFETAEKIAQEHDVILMLKEKEEIEDLIIEEDDEADLKPRSPIVTVMGHVDHGKTSLLDYIRKTTVIDKEAGGITQHIGASEVVIDGKKIVFLDTPGHEAFTEMRIRGAQITDVVIIVVAADDGIMPQTLEAIDHVKAANVPMIIAINKIDKPAANIERVRQELSEKGVLVESWGGDIPDIPISAKRGDNVDLLLEMVLLVSDLEELKANPNRKAVGTVIESKLDKGRGAVASVLIQNGTLKVGDSCVVGSTYGKIRAMINTKGNKTGRALPSTAVEILGLNEVPNAGDQLVVVDDDKTARQIAEDRKERIRDEYMRVTSKISLEDLFEQMQHGELKELNLVIKADVQGSVEAVKSSLEKISNEEVKVNVIRGGVGAITESDIMLASASNAIVIGFNVRPISGAKSMAESEHVDMRIYRVIYDAIEDIQSALKGMLAPKFVEEELGKAEIRSPFRVPKVGMVAGSYVLEGKIQRNAEVRLVRDGIVIYEGKISSLRRFKDDVKEVNTGYECGIGLENFNDIKEGDIIENYIMKEVAH